MTEIKRIGIDTSKASTLTKIDPPLLIRIDPLTCFLPTLSR
jgi:hypothetical protein